MTTPSPTNTPVRDALIDDHQHLDALLDGACASASADALDALDANWRLLENELLAHLDREEVWMLPVFDRYSPADAAAIRADHAHVRRELGELGVLIELHAIRSEQIESFAARLREHAAREQAGLYRWVDEGLPEIVRPTLLRRLGHALRLPRASKPPASAPSVSEPRLVR